MAIRRIFFQNTSVGHNKDYLIEWDQDANTVTSTWGPIGGTHASRSIRSSSAYEANKLVSEKMERRRKRGYGLMYDNTERDVAAAALPPIPVMRYNDFDADLREMRIIEKSHARA